MEESITLKDFLAYYKKTMRLEPVDAGSYSPLVLAYIGDAVYEVMIRARVINRGSMQVNKMHKRSAMLVNAGTQAQLIRSIEEELTPQEHAVYKRGRNASPHSHPRGATRREYQMATGLEALFGWLYLRGETDRLNALFAAMMEGED